METRTWAERKRHEQAQTLREEIAQAAFAEFAERGYHQTSIADITRRVGVSAGTFYNYFKSKREILDHVVDRLGSRLVAAFSEANAPDAPTSLDAYREQALRMAAAVDDILTADERAARLLLFQSTSIDAALTDKVLGFFDLFGEIATAYLQNGIKRGFVRADLDVRHSADAATGLLLAAMLRTVRSQLSAEDRARLRAATVEVFLSGVRYSPSPESSPESLVSSDASGTT